jgi:5-methyltetrahydrofolate--homocysteine methyltransferase
VTDASGRILSGQTVTAFWHSVRHARPLAVGLNCALGAALMRPYIQELAKAAPDTFISCYPNAGLPNPMSDTGFDETPEVTSRLVHEFAAEGLVNIVGGCCGTTPDHIDRAGRGAGQDAPLVLPRGGLRASRCLDLRAKLSDSGRISDSLSPCGKGWGEGAVCGA